MSKAPKKSEPGPGHNSGNDHKGIAAQHLKSFIERAERLEVDKSNVADDMKEMWKEAKGQGFDVKIMKRVVKLRKMDKDDRQEEEAILQLYLDSIGE